MIKISRSTMLNYISNTREKELDVNVSRKFLLNNSKVKKGYIVYLCEREVRAKDNFALQFAINKSRTLNLPLKIVCPQVIFKYNQKQRFIDAQIEQVAKIFYKSNHDFQIINEPVKEFLEKIDVAILIVDFNPILNRKYLRAFDFMIYEIDGHNIVPIRFVSDKQEYSAGTFRPKIYRAIDYFLTEFDNFTLEKVEADYVLEDFIINKLPYYAEFKNDVSKDVLSGLSKYLNLGFISSQRIVLEVLKSNASNDNKECFLEEIVVRSELADNFCLYAKSFKNFLSIPNWAISSLKLHEYDLRSYIYSKKELDIAKTHDKLWNATQFQLKMEGKIHGYLRMYWAKKILEWTNNPKEALDFAIYLNDKYAYDAPSSNGYVGILWAIGGLHDRAFADYPVTGKIRRMTYDSLRRKFDLTDYIQRYLSY